MANSVVVGAGFAVPYSMLSGFWWEREIDGVGFQGGCARHKSLRAWPSTVDTAVIVVELNLDPQNRPPLSSRTFT
jgi:hypothetical protein